MLWEAEGLSALQPSSSEVAVPRVRRAQSVVWGPPGPPSGSVTPQEDSQNLAKLLLMVMVYYSKRIQIKITRGRGSDDRVERGQVQASGSRGGVVCTMHTSPAVTRDV